MTPTPFRLRGLPFAARLSLSFVILVLAGGYLAAAVYLKEHHKGRVPQAVPGEAEPFTRDDAIGVYHGIQSASALRAALESGHPGELPGQSAPEKFTRSELMRWLAAPDDLIGNWDSFDFGEVAPADLLAENCLQCHARGASSELRSEPFLEFADDLRAVAFDRDVSPTATIGLLASTHAHALALGPVALIAMLLLYSTRFGGFLKGSLSLLACAGLAFDIGGWWLTRLDARFVDLILAGGAAHIGGVCLGLALVVLDLWLPARGESGLA